MTKASRTLTLTLDAATADRLETAARDAGVTTSAYVADLLDRGPSHLTEDAAPFATDAPDLEAFEAFYATPEGRRTRAWQQEQARIALAEYDRTGESVSLEQWASEFRADVERRLATRR